MGTASKLTQTLVLRDPDGHGHALRVTELALRIAAALAVGERRLQAIRTGGPLHDIGKLELDRAILDKPGALDPEELDEIRAHPELDRAILDKPGALDPEELDEIRAHPELGARMLRGIRSMRSALDCVLHHHERWDGTGYPYGLGGHEIPLEARILAVADAYDAMTSDRPYRSARSPEEARAEVERCAGSQFDPHVAGAFLAL